MVSEPPILVNEGEAFDFGQKTVILERNLWQTFEGTYIAPLESLTGVHQNIIVSWPKSKNWCTLVQYTKFFNTT